jgi:hypothetical protein
MDDTLRDLVQGRLASHQLPRAIHVWDLEEGLGDLRHLSFHEQVEWGGCIVLEESRLRILHPVCGRKDGVEPACAPEEHAGYVGFAHIHLPDEGGVPYFGFSERDFRATLVDGDNLALVSDGAEVYALVRTADRTQPPRIPGTLEFEVWERLYEDWIRQARDQMAADPEAQRAGSDALNRALLDANKEMCRRLGFALYAGTWGQALVRLYRPEPRL